MNFFQPLIDPSFWFDLQPGGLTPVFEQFFFFVFGAMIILGAISRIVARHRREDRYLVKVYRQVSQLFFTMGVLGMLIFFFTFEEAYFLGARFWFLLWAIGCVVWAMYIVHLVRVDIPARKEAQEQAQADNQYLPRKKRKK